MSLGAGALEGLVEPGNSSGRGEEVSIVTLQAATARTSPEGAWTRRGPWHRVERGPPTPIPTSTRVPKSNYAAHKKLKRERQTVCSARQLKSEPD